MLKPGTFFFEVQMTEYIIYRVNRLYSTTLPRILLLAYGKVHLNQILISDQVQLSSYY